MLSITKQATAATQQTCLQLTPGIAIARPYKAISIQTFTAVRANGIARATLLPGSTPNTQRLVAGNIDMELPISAVQKLPLPAQSAVFLAIYCLLGFGTYQLTCTSPAWTRSLQSVIICSILFLAAGVGHFTAPDGFLNMMPHKGAWGFWYLPGSDSFHVNWTGVAEVLGGAGLLASAIPSVAAALPWLQSVSALCLFYLTLAVTPANIYMFTHNTPGFAPTAAPWPAHVLRLVLQVLLCTALWGLAHPPALA